jgi:8-hydroxy-5-deazaflavin:NADPH oxidoreductase
VTAEERVAVIGATGPEGFGLALRWAAGGRSIVIGSRDEGRAQEAASRLRKEVREARVEGLVNGEAAAACGVVVVTVPFAGQAAIYKSIAERLKPGAVVVDCTVPLAASIGGRASRTLGVWEGSAAQQAQGLLPKGTVLCAAFHSLAASALADLDTAMEGDVLVCGSKAGKDAVKALVELIPRLRYVDAGPLESARLVEPLTALLVGINRRYGTHGAGLRITGI